jgi:hypothetical protein
MRSFKKSILLKFIIFISIIFGVVANASAQNTRKNNFFADIKSIDLGIYLNGEHQFCGIRENEIRSAVGYTLSNSPLRKIDADSPDILSISLIAQNDKTVSGKSLGCSVALTFELRRIVNFRGKNNFVTVWSNTFIQGGQEKDMGGLINSIVERTTKEFVVNWAEQN